MLPAWLRPQAKKIAQRIKNRKWPGSYLYELNKHLGANELAREIIIRLLCTNKESPGCQRCEACEAYLAGSNPDILPVKRQEGSQSIKIDDLREAITKSEKTPILSQFQVLYVEDCEKMTVQCANAILKTLEEPKSSLFIVLHTESLNQLMATIKSRCQVETIVIDSDILDTEVDNMLELNRKYEFLKYTHRDKPLELKAVLQKDKTYELYEIIVESMSTSLWQPLMVSERLATHGLEDTIDGYLNCVGAMWADMAKLQCKQKELYDTLKKEFKQIEQATMSLFNLEKIQKELLEVKKTIKSGVVHTGNYLGESLMIKIWQIMQT